jgi:16S rRNA (uracil1498-N3)-methyltransferase
LSAKERLSDLHWFYADFGHVPETLPNRVIVEDPDLAHHLKTVMRLKPGDGLILVNEPEQQPYSCVLGSVRKDQVEITLAHRIPVSPEKGIQVSAAVSLIKGPRWDWGLQKLTELGVTEIIPLETQRTVVEVKNPQGKQERWEYILKQAAAQCERRTLPRLHSTIALSEFIQDSQALGKETTKLFASERSGDALHEVLISKGTPSRIVFAVGPEGGWDPSEIQLLQDGGFHAVSLGDKILRSETAALYLAAVIQYVSHTYTHQYDDV